MFWITQRRFDDVGKTVVDQRGNMKYSAWKI